MENLNGYVAPEVRVIEVEVEKGFAVSQVQTEKSQFQKVEHDYSW